MLHYLLQDDVDEDEDEDDDDDEDVGEGDDDDDDESGDEEEEETWQVATRTVVPAGMSSGLTSGSELPRLTAICQLDRRWTRSAGPAS